MKRRSDAHYPGFPDDMRARDLAYEFERYGELVRCDSESKPQADVPKVALTFVPLFSLAVPAPKTPKSKL